jgi:small subunit ribosomal protein S15
MAEKKKIEEKTERKEESKKASEEKRGEEKEEGEEKKKKKEKGGKEEGEKKKEVGEKKVGEREERKKEVREVKITKEKVEQLVEQLYKEGYPPEKIGMILRDSYGIGNVKEITGKKIVKILREKGYKVMPSDLDALIKKARNLVKHLENHKHDYKTKRALQIIEARIRILTNYYKKKGILESTFEPKI